MSAVCGIGVHRPSYSELVGQNILYWNWLHQQQADILVFQICWSGLHCIRIGCIDGRRVDCIQLVGGYYSIPIGWTGLH